MDVMFLSSYKYIRAKLTCLQRTQAVTVWCTLSRVLAVSGESVMIAFLLSAIYSHRRSGIGGVIQVIG